LQQVCLHLHEKLLSALCQTSRKALSHGSLLTLDWQAIEGFKKCLRIKEPQFMQHAGLGVLQAPCGRQNLPTFELATQV
jgi:hypothetical protein